MLLLLLFVCCCFCYLSQVLFICLFFFSLSLATRCGLWALGSPVRGEAWASGVGAQSPGHWTAREFLGLGNINQRVRSWRYPYQHQDLAPHNWLQAPVLDTSCQTTSKTGTQPRPSADRLPKVVLSSQTPQNTPPDAALPCREERLSSTHQSTGTSPSHQETVTSPRTNLTHQEADNRSKRNDYPTACRKETINKAG